LNNLSLCSTADASNVTRALLRGVFNLGADLDHLLLVLPDGSSKVDDLLSRYFVLAPVSVPGNWSVFLCSRQNFVSTLYVRSARVEDHDDLATVFESQSEVVAERFGTFFLSEQIESQSQKNRVLVGEGSDGRAVGLLSASTDVPTELLQKCFETTPYGHLVTRSELLRAYDARGTVLASRQSVDWLSVLGVHSDELPAVFDAIPHVDCAGTSLMATSAPEQTVESTGIGADLEDLGAPIELSGEETGTISLREVATVFDHKGDAWGYVGIGGIKMGHAMLVDLGFVVPGLEIPDVAVTRSQLNKAVEAFSSVRNGVQRCMRTSTWFAAVPTAEPVVAVEEESKEAEVPVVVAAGGKAAPAPEPSPAPAVVAPIIQKDVGRKLVTEEFDKLVVQLDAERKDNLRRLQMDVMKIQKEIEAVISADRIAQEAAAKEAYENEVAHGGSANSDDPHAGAGGSHAHLFHHESKAAKAKKAELESQLEAKSQAVIAAQSTITSVIRVPLDMLASSITNRLESSPETGSDFVSEMASFLAESSANLRAAGAAAKAAAEAAAAAAGPGTAPKNVLMDASDSKAVTKACFIDALSAWEKRALPLAVSPCIVVSTSYARAKSYVIPLREGEDQELPAPATTCEWTTAQTVSNILKIPHVHLPALLVKLSADFKQAEEDVAKALEKIRQEEELKKKKEEEAAKKALAAGPVKKKAAKKEEPPRVLPSNSLIDPSKDAFAAVLQYLQAQSAQYIRGMVLTGAPLTDASACSALTEVLTVAGCPPALNIHVEEGRAHAAHSHEFSAANEKPSTSAYERTMKSARNRRASITPQFDAAAEKYPVSVLPSSGQLGRVVRIEGRRSRLTHLYSVVARALAGGSTPIGIDRKKLPELLTEPVTSLLLREGFLRIDPTESSQTSKPLSEDDYKREAHSGDSNAFSITLFCLAHVHETRYVDLLAAAFEAFPDREYAIITQPFTAPDLPLLRRFVQVLPTANSTIQQSLYICHRDSLVAPALMTVRRAVMQDRSSIRAIVTGSSDIVEFMDAVVASERRNHLPLFGETAARIACFVAEVDGQVVACVVLAETGADAASIEAAALSFELDAHIVPKVYYDYKSLPVDAPNTEIAGLDEPTKFASLCFSSVNPAFMSSVPYFFRESARLYGGRSGLLYRQAPSPLGAHIASQFPASVREHMILVRPRTLQELAPSELKKSQVDRLAADAALTARGYYIPDDGVSYSAHSVVKLSPTELSDPRRLDHALYLFSARLSSFPRYTINSRIVIIGASDGALASAAEIVLNDGSLRLPHLTLLATGGLPVPCDFNATPSPFTPGREFSSFELSRLPLSMHMRIVDDHCRKINRKEKSLILGTSNSILKYDRLILLPGLTEASWAKLGFEGSEKMPRGMHCITNANHLSDLEADVEAIVVSSDESRQVVVYGETLEALTTINALLNRGVKGSQILHLRPSNSAEASASSTENLFDDEFFLSSLVPTSPAPISDAALFASRAIASILEQAGVQEMVNAEIISVTGEPQRSGKNNADSVLNVSLPPGLNLQVKREIRQRVKSLYGESKTDSKSSEEEDRAGGDSHAMGLSFGSESNDGHGELAPPPPPETHETLTIHICLLICANTRDVSPSFFKAVNDCGIVYDGRLVVDHRFIATDPSVYGGATVAKLSRRYRAPNLLQEYDSRECGAAVSKSLLSELNPNGSRYNGSGDENIDSLSSSQLLNLLPRFTQPKVKRALLPGNLQYMTARLPEFEYGPAGKEIVTHTDSKPDGSGLRHTIMLLSRFNVVAQVTYIGSDPIETINMSRAVGKNASFFNGLVRRSEKKDLPDLISFMRQAWGNALFHDRFLGLVDKLRLIISGPYASKDVAMLTAQTRLLLQEGSSVSDDGESAEDRLALALKTMSQTNVGVGGKNLPSETRQKIQDEVLEFLKRNRLLNMYLTETLK
jgi:hypothetical protein